jgi:hypothetical protein
LITNSEIKGFHFYLSRNMARQTNKLELREQQSFALRLKAALASADVPVKVTEVWKQFNSLSNDSPVTQHAVRKWLMGQAIPTQQRIRVLSAWLKVESNWLRFGENSDEDERKAPSIDEKMLLKSYRRLPLIERQKLLSLIQTMAIGRSKGGK